MILKHTPILLRKKIFIKKKKIFKQGERSMGYREGVSPNQWYGGRMEEKKEKYLNSLYWEFNYNV